MEPEPGQLNGRLPGEEALVGVGDHPLSIFISYTHEPEHHREAVVELANRLREDGFESWIDRYVPAPAEGWVRWMRRKVEGSDYTLLFWSEAYCRRFEGQEKGKGGGARFEATLAETVLYRSGMESRRIVPVLPDGEPESFVPLSFDGCSRYFYPSQYEALVRHLENRSEIEPPPIQPRRQKPTALSIPDIRPVPDIEEHLESQPQVEPSMVQPLELIGARGWHGWIGWVFLILTFFVPLCFWIAHGGLMSRPEQLALSVSEALLAGASGFFLGPEVLGPFARVRLPQMLLSMLVAVVALLFWLSPLSFLRSPERYQLKMDILDYDHTPVSLPQPTLQLAQYQQAGRADGKSWLFDVPSSSTPWGWDGRFEIIAPRAGRISGRLDYRKEGKQNLSLSLPLPRLKGYVIWAQGPIEAACVRIGSDTGCRDKTKPDGKFEFAVEAHYGAEKLLEVVAPGFCSDSDWRLAGDQDIIFILHRAPMGGCP